MTDADEIYGLGQTPEHYDVLMQTHASSKWRSHETDLMTSKWWDYRFMHPTEATYLFAHHYREQYRNAFDRYFDKRQAYRRDTLAKHHDPMKNAPGAVTGIWRARQFADSICCPYDLYIRWAIDARMRFWQRAYLPRPCHLYADVVTDQVIAKWEEHLSAKFTVASHDAYKVENYAGLPDQDAHVEWVFERAKVQPNILHALQNAYRRGLISAAHITAKYNESVTEKVIEVLALAA